MANDEHTYKRVTFDEIIAAVTQDMPSDQRDEERKSQKSLEDKWEPRKQRYEVAAWISKGLFFVFAGVIAWSGLLMLVLLIHGMRVATINQDLIDLVTYFIKDILPFIATPLGVAMGFYFREFRSESNGE